MWTLGGFLVLFFGACAAENAVFPEEFTGLAPSVSRIVSGWESVEGQHPFQLSLRMVSSTGSVTSCGGSIIHAAWGLTAAHCTALRYTLVVRTGAVSLTTPENIFEVTEHFTHPLYIDAYQSIVQPNDISLLKFPFEIEFTARVQPIRLQRDAEKNRDYDGDQLIASGWGRTWTDGTAPEKMNWVYLKGVSNRYCLQRFSGSIIEDSTICAAYWNVTSQSTCQGDSGGPLTVTEQDGVRTLVGVTSFVSSSGCHTDFPAGFIRPGHYHDWYLERTGINFDWEPTWSSEESSEETPETSKEDSESEETTEKPEEETPPAEF